MSIVIDCSIYFDRLYNNYLKFRKAFRHKGSMLINPVSMALDYIMYTITHTERLLKKYRFKVLYFNVNHRIGFLKRSSQRQRVYNNRLAHMFKDMARLMSTTDISGIYMKYHEYFKDNLERYSLKDIDNRKIGYDYDNMLPQMELQFIEQALIEQNYLSPEDIYYCNLLILNAMDNCRIIYTNNSNIDYFKYHKARFIRNPNWRQYKRNESIVEKPILTHSLYEHFKDTRKLPLIDCCQTNSYDIFILTDNPFKMYVNDESRIFLDEGLLDDYIEVIDKLNEPIDEALYSVFIESIEPTEMTENDINIVLESIVKRWNSLYDSFNLNRLKDVQKQRKSLKNIVKSPSISVDSLMEIV